MYTLIQLSVGLLCFTFGVQYMDFWLFVLATIRICCHDSSPGWTLISLAVEAQTYSSFPKSLWLSFIITSMGRILNCAQVHTHMLNLILLNPNYMQLRVRKTHRLKIKTPFNLTFAQNLTYYFLNNLKNYAIVLKIIESIFIEFCVHSGRI